MTSELREMLEESVEARHLFAELEGGKNHSFLWSYGLNRTES